MLEHVYVYNVFISGQINSPISLNMAESNPVSVAYPYRRCQAAFGIYAAKTWLVNPKGKLVSVCVSVSHQSKAVP